MSGDALLAVVFAAATAVPQAVLALVGPLGSSMSGALGQRGAAVAFNVAMSAIGALVWLLTAYAVTRRTGVRSLWIVPLSAILPVLAFAASTVLMMGGAPGLRETLLGAGIILAVTVPSVLAALAGVELALRRRPATLADTPVTQDPDADRSAPDDTAGGTDG